MTRFAIRKVYIQLADLHALEHEHQRAQAPAEAIASLGEHGGQFWREAVGGHHPMIVGNDFWIFFVHVVLKSHQVWVLRAWYENAHRVTIFSKLPNECRQRP